MKILFITSNRIGDAVISTGLLSHLIGEHPDAEITVACGPLVARLFAMVPNVVQVIPIEKQSYNCHWIKLWKETIGTSWDIIVDLRNSAVSRLIRARQRHCWKKIDESKHKVEQNALVMGLDHTPSPKLWLSDDIKSEALKLIPDGSVVIGIGPAANWKGKTWSRTSFIDIIERLTSNEGPFPEARVVVFAAPGEEDQATPVLDSIPEDLRINLIAKGDPALAAACLERCAFYIGNDSGLMHCSAAVGVSTLGLFGPSYPQWYAPWGDNCAYVATPQNFDELTSFEGYNKKTTDSLMDSLTVDAVYDSVIKLLG